MQPCTSGWTRTANFVTHLHCHPNITRASSFSSSPPVIIIIIIIILIIHVTSQGVSHPKTSPLELNFWKNSMPELNSELFRRQWRRSCVRTIASASGLYIFSVPRPGCTSSGQHAFMKLGSKHPWLGRPHSTIDGERVICAASLFKSSFEVSLQEGPAALLIPLCTLRELVPA